MNPAKTTIHHKTKRNPQTRNQIHYPQPFPISTTKDPLSQPTPAKTADQATKTTIQSIYHEIQPHSKKNKTNNQQLKLTQCDSPLTIPDKQNQNQNPIPSPATPKNPHPKSESLKQRDENRSNNLVSRILQIKHNK